MEKNSNVQRLGASRNPIYYWIVYQTTNLVNNKIYIGVHKTKTPYEFDGYLGCGAYINNAYTYEHGKTYFHNALKKYGVKNFRRTTLKVFDDEALAYAEEARLVDTEFLRRNDVYNMILGGNTTCGTSVVPVYMYDLQGNYIQEFESQNAGAEFIGKRASGISEACTTNISYGGFYWSKVKNTKLDLSQYHSIQTCIPIYQYSIDGDYIQEFPSTRATGYSQAAQSAILGNIVDKKYYFCYVKADTYSKARDIYVKNRLIYQYDANGKFLKEWSYLEALKTFPKDSINQAIRHKLLTASGYFWGLQKYEEYNVPVKKQNKQIGKYDLNGNLIATYPNSSTCYAENGKGAYKNLVGLRKTYKGFVYKYIE